MIERDPGGSEREEYPQVTSSRHDNTSWAITIRRRRYLITRFRVEDDEVEPLIEHLRSLHTDTDP